MATGSCPVVPNRINAVEGSDTTKFNRNTAAKYIKIKNKKQGI